MMQSDVKSPLVTVLMSVYDGDKPELLATAVESILKQSYANIEFLVVSDGIKRNELLEVLDHYAKLDSRLQLLQLVDNKGLANALNSAIVVARGEMLIRMDADDISPPERVERLVHFMETQPDIDVAGSYIIEFTDENSISSGKKVAYPLEHDEMLSCFLRRNPLAHASAVFRRTFFEKAGRYPLFSVRNEDTLLWLSGFKAGCRFANLPESLYFVRHDTGSAGRRVGFRKSFSDFVDRLRVLVDLHGRPLDYCAAFAMLFLQNMPRSIYLGLRSLLIHSK